MRDNYIKRDSELHAYEPTSEALLLPVFKEIQPDEAQKILASFENDCKTFIFKMAKAYGLNIEKFNLLEIKEFSLVNNPPEHAKSYILRENPRSSRAFVLEHILREDNSTVFRIYQNSDKGIKFLTWFDPRDKKNQHTVFSYEDLNLYTNA